MFKTLGKLLLPVVVSMILTILAVIFIDIVLGFLTKGKFTTSAYNPICDGYLLASDKIITQTFNFEDGIHTAHH